MSTAVHGTNSSEVLLDPFLEWDAQGKKQQARSA